jgi:glyoxylase-like metal-dependent hydrolase (beta-lactamase superfamily II)
MLNEVVFFHPSSRTLIATDLVFNVRGDQPWGIPSVSRLLGVGGRFGPSRLGRWLILDKEAARASLGMIMRWDFDRVILAHGDIIESGGYKKGRVAFGFILGAASRVQ